MPSTVVVKPRMNMPAIKAKAQAYGISPGRMKKADLIHQIQLAEGCTACYGSGSQDCPWTDCCFREDCLKIK
ncbi:MAG: hypothetical protein JW720_13005 [Sedimentisphaerales bacterium]|nr:hypothetical protein [Sedimentisphaerales bacterium]